ncbi:Uncharacterised protein [Salmonella enterica subsp. enterica]|nr:Uncharacterised protein [Salmonella enterica subsp. enterica]
MEITCPFAITRWSAMAIQRIAKHALKISRYRQCVLIAASHYRF